MRSRIATAAALWASVLTVASAILAVSATRSSAAAGGAAHSVIDPVELLAQRGELGPGLDHHRADLGAHPGSDLALLGANLLGHTAVGVLGRTVDA